MTRSTFTLLLAAALLSPSGARADDKPAARAAAEAGPVRKAGGETWAVFVTSRGRIAARLLPGQAPKAVKNFVELATGKKEWTDPRNSKKTRAKLYDGTVFHRVIPGFMIQGGDPLGNGAGSPGYRFDDEIKASDKPFDQPCQLAMANSGPNTNGSQFFITEVATPHLNPRSCANSKTGVCGYVHFGVGICGCEKVREIALGGNSTTRLEKVLIVHEQPSCN